MRKRFIHSMMVVAAALAIPSVLLAQSAAPPRAASSTPDLSGVWAQLGSAGSGTRLLGTVGNRRFRAEDPPLQPWALELFQRNRRSVERANEAGLDEFDPSTWCFPQGPTKIYTIPRPIQIVQTPSLILLLSEADHTVRRIYLDGRGHPDGYPLVWQGHSAGKWGGDPRVVDTTHARPETWLETIGTPHSDALHIVERFRRVSQDTLEIDFLFDDPKAFTEPWGGKKIYRWKPEWEILDHAICEDFLEMGKGKQ